MQRGYRKKKLQLIFLYCFGQEKWLDGSWKLIQINQSRFYNSFTWKTLKYFSISNNKPPASWVADITKDFLHVIPVRIIVPCSNIGFSCCSGDYEIRLSHIFEIASILNEKPSILTKNLGFQFRRKTLDFDRNTRYFKSNILKYSVFHILNFVRNT